MSHSRCHPVLLAAAALALGAAPCFAAPTSAQPDPAARICMQHLQVIGRALQAYRNAHNGALPAHLSDLYPRYLKDKAMFHCPADPTPGSLNITAVNRSPRMARPDPRMRVSYLYEMSTDPATFSVPFGPAPDGKVSWQQQKRVQREYLGDRVPVVRCLHHRPLDRSAQISYLPTLALSGKVFRTTTAWEMDPASVPFLLDSMERDLKAGPHQFRTHWSLDAMAGYFARVPPVPALRRRLSAAAERLAVVTYPRAAAGPQAAAVGGLYRTAGDTERARAAYATAMRLPGNHALVAGTLANEYLAARRPEQAVAVLNQVIAENPAMEREAGPLKYYILATQIRNPAKAQAYGSHLVESVFNHDPVALARFAWGTVAPDAPKSGPDAVRLALTAAQRADVLVHGNNAGIATTLARAYFVAGDPAKALEIQERAVRLGTPRERSVGLARLAQYRKAVQRR